MGHIAPSGGAFHAEVTYPVPAEVDVTAVDINGDGKLDLVTSGGDPVVRVLLGRGDGTFGAFASYSTGSQGRLAGVTDLDGDGKPDLVTASHQSSAMAVVLGNGDGSFRPGVEYPAGAALSPLVVADMNRDGRPDVIALDALGLAVRLGTCMH